MGKRGLSLHMNILAAFTHAIYMYVLYLHVITMYA